MRIVAESSGLRVFRPLSSSKLGGNAVNQNVSTLKADAIRTSRARSLLLLFTLIAGCRDELPSGGPRQTAEARNAPYEIEVRPEERYLFELEERFPGFGGYGVDTFGVRRVWVGNTVAAAEVLQAIEAGDEIRGLSGSRRAAPGASVVSAARFSVSTLGRVRDYVTKNYFVPGSGLVGVDLNEATNRVAVGVLGGHEAELRSRLEADLTKLGLPPTALDIYITTMSSPSVAPATLPRAVAMRRQSVNQTLWTAAVPMLGGIREIHAGASAWSCTMGLIVTRNGVPGVIGNSHCSPTMYSLDSGHVVHNGIYPNHAFGFETVDPPGTSCAAGGSSYLCRFSDAVFYQVYDTVSVRRGAIARTQSYATTWGDSATLVLNQSNLFYAVTAVAPPGLIQTGYYLMKVGKTTGRTEGQIVGTCDDRLFTDGYVRRCSTIAKYFADGGDSGGPVWFSSGGDGVMLAGLHFGHNDVDKVSFSSLWTRVQDELGGSIVSTTDVTVATPVIGITFPSLVPILAWNSVATTNTVLPTTYRVYRWTYDAELGWTESQQLVHTTQALTFEDSDRLVNLCYGSSPAPSGVSFVKYQVVAESHGVASASTTISCRSFGAS